MLTKWQCGVNRVLMKCQCYVPILVSISRYRSFHFLDAVTIVLFQVLGAFSNIPFDTNRTGDEKLEVDVRPIMDI